MKMFNVKLFSILIVLVRVLFGIGWFLAGLTKITEKSWFKEPGVYLVEYLQNSTQQTNVPLFYKYFIETFAIEHVMILNYVIPVVQIVIGLLLIVGLFSLQSIMVCLFMHINFILSGNMNLISLILYTNAFTLIIFRQNMYFLSLDKYLHIKMSGENKKETTIPLSSSNKERLFSN